MLSENKYAVETRSIFCKYPGQAKAITDGLTESGLVSSLNQVKQGTGTRIEYSFDPANKEQIAARLNKILDTQIQQITGVNLDRG